MISKIKEIGIKKVIGIFIGAIISTAIVLFTLTIVLLLLMQQFDDRYDESDEHYANVTPIMEKTTVNS